MNEQRPFSQRPFSQRPFSQGPFSHDTVRRRTWHALSAEQKQERLAALRHRQQRQVELELRMLHHAGT